MMLIDLLWAAFRGRMGGAQPTDVVETPFIHHVCPTPGTFFAFLSILDHSADVQSPISASLLCFYFMSCALAHPVRGGS